MPSFLQRLYDWLIGRHPKTKDGGVADPVVPGQYDSDVRIPGQSPDIDYPPGTPGNPTTPGEVQADRPLTP